MKKTEEPLPKESVADSTGKLDGSAEQKSPIKVKGKKSTVAIVWSSEEEKAEMTKIEKPSALAPSKFVSRDAFSHPPKETKK